MGNERPRLRDILADDELKKIHADAGVSVAEITKALASLSGTPAGTFEVGMWLGGWLGETLGFKSSQREERAFSVPYTALVRALVLALASDGYSITAQFDTPKGAFIEAQLPKDFRSFGGTLRFEVVDERADAVRLVAISEVKGQMFDWGKGRQALNDVLMKTQLFASRLQA